VKNYVLFSMLIGGVSILFALAGCFGDADPALTSGRLVFGSFGYPAEYYGVTACLDTSSSPGSVVIPDAHDGRTVSGIGNFAFARCGNISSLTIPASVIHIGSNAFQECGRLSEIVMHAETPPVLAGNAFLGCVSLAAIRVPEASLPAYQTAAGWSEMVSIIVADTASSSSSSSAGAGLYDPDPASFFVVNNNGNSDIILFNEDAIPANLLGGVKAFTRGHGVPKMPSGIHVVKVVTAGDYAANPASPKVCYSFLVNTDYTPGAYDINVTSGDCVLRINNLTDGYLEIRNTAYTGPRVAVLRPSEALDVYRPEGELTLYAVVQYPRLIAFQSPGLKVLRSIQQSVSLLTGNTALLTVQQADVEAANHSGAYFLVNNESAKSVTMTGSGVTSYRDAWNKAIITTGEIGWSYNYEMTGDTMPEQSFTFVSAQYVIMGIAAVPACTRGHVYTITIPSSGTTASVVDSGTYETFFP